MIITTHQPIFLPWPGFFYKAFCADTMVLLDDVQFPLGRSWITRNRLKSDQGELWLTVPVWRKGRGKQIIRKVEICNDTDWRSKHMYSIRQVYANAPYLEDHLPRLESIYARRYLRLSDLNNDLIRFLRDALGLERKLVLQSELGVTGHGTELLVSICRALDASTFVTLPAAEKYLDARTFQRGGIELVYAHFHPPAYPQLWGEMRYNLSALDLLLTCGPKSLEIITRCGIST